MADADGSFMVFSAPLSPFYDSIIANALQPSKLAAASRLPLPRHSQSAIAKVQTLVPSPNPSYVNSEAVPVRRYCLHLRRTISVLPRDIAQCAHRGV